MNIKLWSVIIVCFCVYHMHAPQVTLYVFPEVRGWQESGPFSKNETFFVFERQHNQVLPFNISFHVKRNLDAILQKPSLGDDDYTTILNWIRVLLGGAVDSLKPLNADYKKVLLDSVKLLLRYEYDTKTNAIIAVIPATSLTLNFPTPPTDLAFVPSDSLSQALLEGKINETPIKSDALKKLIGHFAYDLPDLPKQYAFQKAVEDPIGLHLAVVNNDATLLQDILTQERYRDQINIQDNVGRTPLHYAALNDFIDGAKILLEHGAQRDITDKASHTPMQLAKSETMKNVLKEHDPSKKTFIKKTLITIDADQNGFEDLMDKIASPNNNELIKKIIEQNPKYISQKDALDRTPLILAIEKKNEELIPFLVEKDPHATREKHKWFNNLYTFAKSEELSLKILEYLSAQTPLHKAVIGDDGLGLDQLLNQTQYQTDKELNAQDVYGFTPLHYAALNDKQTMAKKLRAAGASTNIPNVYGKVPLQIAQSEAMKAILEQQVIQRAEKPLIQKIPMLIDVTKKNQYGESPLYEAVNKNDKDFVQNLLNLNALVDEGDDRGVTPLMLASQKGNIDIMKILIDHKAQLEKKDRLDKTALFHAISSGHFDATKLLVESGAKIDITDYSKNTLLHGAIEAGATDIIDYLLAKNLNVNAQNSVGDTPLHIAIRQYYEEVEPAIVHKKTGYLAIIKKLLQKKSDLTLKNYEGKTPLEWAQYQHPTLMKPVIELLQRPFVDETNIGQEFTQLYNNLVALHQSL